MDKYPGAAAATATAAYYPDPRTPRARSGKTNLASCAVAAAFLLLVLLALAAVFFFLLRPRGPHIQIDAIHLPDFTSRNGSVSFTFAQHAAVRNPNRAAFSHFDSTIRLIYAGSQVGFMYIPAGEIGGGRTEYMEASFTVSSFQLSGSGPTAEVESRMRLKGRVTVLRFLAHHVEAMAGCRVGVSAGDGAVLGLRC